MSPTSSSRPFAGRKALSATPRTNSLPSALRRLPARPSAATDYGRRSYSRKREPSPKLAPLDGWPMPPPDPAPALVAAGMVAAGMRDIAPTPRRRARRRGALAAAGCGGERQDADAPSGEFDLEVTRASFPAEQRIAEAATLRLEVANTRRPRGARPGRDGRDRAGAGRRRRRSRSAQRDDDPTLAASARPVWIVDEGPAGGDSAYTNTWAVGPLGEGQTRTVEWRLTAVKAGPLHGRLAARARAGGRRRARRRRAPRGEFEVTIADEPVPARVNGDGEVVRGEESRRRVSRRARFSVIQADGERHELALAHQARLAVARRGRSSTAPVASNAAPEPARSRSRRRPRPPTSTQRRRPRAP